MTTTPEQAGQPQRLNIQKEAVCLSLKLGMLRTRRRISTSQITTDADPTMVHVSKDILESDELKNINRHHGDIRSYLRSRCLPSPFRSGIYLLRLALIQEVLEQLNVFERQNGGLVTRFMVFYQKVHAERNDPSSPFREKLGSLYSAEDYPDPKIVGQAFRFETQLWELSTPGALRTIDRALYEREAAKMQNVWESARQQITQVLLQEFRDLTTRMAERLTPSPDGTTRVFRDSLVGNLQEWLDIFDKRALTDDQELVSFVQKARAMVSGIKPELIRDSDGLRADLARDMQALSRQIDVAIVTQPGRVLELDNEEEA
jgi:hypothetical protein